MSNRGSALRPGTASRLKTGVRPETKGGAAIAAGAANVRFEDRPMTQQGLGGLKTGGKGLRRQVEDKSYYIGILRTKINELGSEIEEMKKSLDTVQEDSASYVQYERMAEQLAADIKSLQGELADYNTIVDKLNTDQDAANIQIDFDELKVQNDREEKQLDLIFEERKQAEAEVRRVELELEQERRMADNLVQQMQPQQQQKYRVLKAENEQFLSQLEAGQQELQELRRRKAHLEDELVSNPVKQEAVRINEQYREVEQRRDALMEETRAAGNPQQERERLLAQVKEDNQEIFNMDRQTKEMQEQLQLVQSEIRATEQDIEDTSGQRSHQYRELRKREEKMDEFLTGFEQNFANEKSRLSELEAQIVELLDFISRSLGRVSSLPSSTDYKSLKDQLDFKAQEKDKSETTANTLSGDHQKIQQDLLKIDQLERKTTEEIDALKEKIRVMREELVKFSDINALVEESERRKKELSDEKSTLSQRRESMKRLTKSLTSHYEQKKKELTDNETHAQLCNLERKWQHNEQNNFVAKEFIATKTVETDTSLVSTKVLSLAQNLNARLVENASKNQTLA